MRRVLGTQAHLNRSEAIEKWQQQLDAGIVMLTRKKPLSSLGYIKQGRGCRASGHCDL